MTRRLSRRTIALVTTVVVLIVAAVVAITVHQLSGRSTESSDARVSTSSGQARSGVTVRRYHYLAPGVGDPRQDYGDLYLPAGAHSRDSLPLVVLIHGGGWTSRYGAGTFDALARTLAARGLAAYNIEYRRLGSGGGWPTTFTDVAAAVDYVPTLDRLNPEINSANATLVGHSAGAQLAVWVGMRTRPAPNQPASEQVWRPTRIISLAGPLAMAVAADTGDTRVTRVLGGSPKQVPDRYRAVDPIENIDPTIPIIVVHGTADRVVSPTQSTTFVDADKRMRGDVRLVLLRGQSHSALVSAASTAFPVVIDLIANSARPSP